MLKITWGEHWSDHVTTVLGCGIGKALPNGMGRGMLRKEPDSMRATQFVRRGLIAFAAVATLSLGFADAVGAQGPAAFPGNSPGAVIDGDSAFVYNPITGYTYDIVHTGGERTAILAVGITGGLNEVVVQFLPVFDGAAIVTPGGVNVEAARAGG